MMTSSQIDTLITNTISYHQTLLDPLDRIRTSQRITALIADRRDALAREKQDRAADDGLPTSIAGMFFPAC